MEDENEKAQCSVCVLGENALFGNRALFLRDYWFFKGGASYDRL